LVTPPHRHSREDETSIVLEGQIGFRSDDAEVVPGPSGYITKPRGQTHAPYRYDEKARYEAADRLISSEDAARLLDECARNAVIRDRIT
jgi:hypothetical protein